MSFKILLLAPDADPSWPEKIRRAVPGVVVNAYSDPQDALDDIAGLHYVTGRCRRTFTPRQSAVSPPLASRRRPCRELPRPEIKFAGDSLLEGDGFELSVPRVGGRFRTTSY